MLSATTAARADDGDKFTDGNLRFTVISEAEHTAAVSGYVTAPVGELVIPSQADNGAESYAVTQIAEQAFNDCQEITSVSIPDIITNIGGEAFSFCFSLKSASLPQSIATIPYALFYCCYDLETVNIPESVTKIEGRAFGDCYSLTSIKFPDSVTKIGQGAFSGCSSLTLLELPESNLEISPMAFSDCTSLTSVDIPETIVYVGFGAFAGSGITSLELPAFNHYCIGEGAFSGCPSLENISIAEGESVYQSIDGILYTDGVTLNSFPGARKDFVVPVFCKSFAMFAFYRCMNLETIEIPNTFTLINSYVFDGCEGLKSIIIPNSVERIEHDAFEFCNSLTTLTLPQSVEFISHGALSEIVSLKKLFILSETPPYLEEDAFYGNYYMSIYIPEGSLDAYESAEEWNKYVNKELSMSIYVETPQLKLTISEKLGVEVGKSDEVTVEIEKADGVEVESERWLSFNPDIATVDENGVVTGVSEGTALIACTVVDNFGCDHREFCNVTVAPSAGIDSIQAAEPDAPAVYYNLNGVRVDGDALAPGFYIKRKGTRAEKILVR